MVSSIFNKMCLDAEITIFEKGPYVAFANCGLPYYIGNVINSINFK